MWLNGLIPKTFLKEMKSKKTKSNKKGIAMNKIPMI